MLRSIMVLSRLLLCSVVHADFDVFQINQTGTGHNPAVSGNIVVWVGGGLGNPVGIYGYNITTGNEFLIDGTTGPAQESWNPDVDGNVVVWQQTDWTHSQISAYNIGSGEYITVAESVNVSEPKVSGNMVLWTDSYYEHAGIFCKDLSSGTIYSTQASLFPDIDGTKVIYYELSLTSIGVPPQRAKGVYVDDILTGESKMISGELDYISAYSTKIDQNNAIWVKDNDIFVYDLVASTLEIIDVDEELLYGADISGDTLVWAGSLDETLYGIYGYDLSTDAFFTIHESDYSLSSPRIDGNLVVWEDSSFGTHIQGAFIPEPATISMLVLGGIFLKRKQFRLS